MSLRSAVEDALFIYDEYDVFEGGDQFYNCTLSVDIGEFKAGTLIETVIIDYDNSSITFFNEKKSYELSLKIGKEIPFTGVPDNGDDSEDEDDDGA